MRYGSLMAGLVALATPAHAESPPRSQYVTMVLQAFAAKVECPGTDVVYQDLAQKAQEMHLPEGRPSRCGRPSLSCTRVEKWASARLTI